MPVLTPWSRVLEQLTDLQLVKKFPAFYGTRKFITAFTRVAPSQNCPLAVSTSIKLQNITTTSDNHGI